MKRGLYCCAGASATTSAAACAKRFDEPITKESNVYLGLRPPPPGTATVGLTSRLRDCGSSRTAITTRRCVPVQSVTAARISSRKCPRIQVFEKSFGTAMTKRSSVRSSPRASPNQVLYVVSLRASRRRLETSVQSSSALSSSCCSIWCGRAPYGPAGRPSIAPPRAPHNADNSTSPPAQKTLICRDLFTTHHTVHRLWTDGGGMDTSAPSLRVLDALSGHSGRAPAVDNEGL